VPRPARAGERGSAVVDFVLVLLVLIPLVIGILQLALVLHVRNTLASAAAEGARHAAVAGSSAPAGQAKIDELVDGALSQDFGRSVTVRPALVGGAPGYEAVVEADIGLLGLKALGGVQVRVAGHAIAEQAAEGTP
jgi:Flp pilus assembly protein TadG